MPRKTVKKASVLKVNRLPSTRKNPVHEPSPLECSLPENRVAMEHVSVGAGPGCGKTSTCEAAYKIAFKNEKPPFKLSGQQEAILEQFRRHRKNDSVGMFAFNKSIATELERRGLPGRTNHSLGMNAVREHFKQVRVDDRGFKVCDILERVGIDRKKDFDTFRLAQEALSLAKQTLTGWKPSMSARDIGNYPEWDQDFTDMVVHYGLDTNGKEDTLRNLLPQALRDCATEVSRMDFDDMIWMPVVHNLRPSQYDLLVVDERQDLNAAQMVLLQRSGHRLICVGDRNQSIYGFSGASPAAFDEMDTWMDNNGGRINLPLLETRRCPKAVVRLLNTINPDLVALPDAPEGFLQGYGRSADSVGPPALWSDLLGDTNSTEGIPALSSRKNTLGPGDMVLCRLNAPLVQMAYKLVRRNIRCRIQGRKFGQGLQGMIRKSKADNIPALVRWVEDHRSKEGNRISQSKYPSEAKLQALNEKCDCLLFLTEGMDNIGQLVSRIENLFSDTQGEGEVLLSSVHRGKGLEANRVFILAPEKMPLVWEGMQPWERVAERNIQFVAWSRTKSDLIFVATPDKSGK